ncbi:hypothetical protein DLY19_18955 [Escherichia coli]|nr:hypothetical protein [Escherichia coli]
MKKNRKLCLSLKRRVNCKIARLRAGQIQTTDEGAGCGVIKSQAILSVFTLAISITAQYESHRPAG